MLGSRVGGRTNLLEDDSRVVAELVHFIHSYLNSHMHVCFKVISGCPMLATENAGPLYAHELYSSEIGHVYGFKLQKHEHKLDVQSLLPAC